MNSNYIALIYVALIKKGRKTIDDVPETIRDEVQKLLNDE